MTVNVKFIGSFRSLAGKDSLGLNVKDAVSFRQVVRMIIKELPNLKQVLIEKEHGSFSSNLLVLVNEKEIGVLDGLETAVNDGDEVVFVPVVHGG